MKLNLPKNEDFITNIKKMQIPKLKPGEILCPLHKWQNPQKIKNPGPKDQALVIPRGDLLY